MANTGESLNIPDAYKLVSGLPYSFNRSYDDLSGYRTQSMLTFPLKTNRGDTIGVLQLINAKDVKGQGRLRSRKKTSRSSCTLPTWPPWPSNGPR